MTTANTDERKDRQNSTDGSKHRFVVGQAVRLKREHGVFTSRSGDIYRITRTMPQSGASLQYHIRNESERHERVAPEDALEPANTARPGEEATLVEKTFGRN